MTKFKKIIGINGGLSFITCPFDFAMKHIPDGIEITPTSISLDKELNYCQAWMKIEDEKWLRSIDERVKSFLNRPRMKSPEQKITDLEKRQEEITKEITELKKELKPKELTFEEIKRKTMFVELDSFQMPFGMYDKMYAVRDLLVVAKFLNADWVADWNDLRQEKHIIWIDNSGDIRVSKSSLTRVLCIFKSEELARKAIQILGEEKIKLALS